MGTPAVSVKVNVTADDRGSYWVGKVERMGVLVYAKSLNDLHERVEKALGLLLSDHHSLDALVGYLDWHGIDHEVRTSVDHDRPQRLRIGRELQVPVA